MFQGSSRLTSSYLNNVETVEELIRNTKKVEQDYEELMTTLTRLSEDLKVEIMVPFTKKAFMPGKLVHTGEVMVYLGDNWFVNRTVHQGIQIAERRVSKIQGDLVEYERVLGNLQEKLGFAEREGQEQIVEELTERDLERVRNRYKAHKPGPNVPKPRSAFSPEELSSPTSTADPAPTSTADPAPTSTADPSPTSTADPSKPLKSILKHRQEESSSEPSSDSEEIDVIRFRHSDNVVTSSSRGVVTSSSHGVVTSSPHDPGSLHPGDIHLVLRRNLEQGANKEQLVPSDVTSTSTNQERSKKDKFDINKTIIKERTVTNENDSQNVTNTRPVSKFRMSRNRA